MAVVSESIPKAVYHQGRWEGLGIKRRPGEIRWRRSEMTKVKIIVR
jgi:hypothetical protein